LFVLDDVWHSEQIDGVLISSAQCATLITTRHLPTAERFSSPGQNKQLPRLPPEAAQRLLSDLVGSDVVASNKAECDDLVTRLDGLPLALTVAGNLIAKAHNRGHPIAQLLNRLREKTELLLSESAPADMQKFLHDVDDNLNVLALLQLSSDELDATTRECYARIGYTAPPHEGTFGFSWMASAWDVEDAEAREIADRLVEAGLIEPTKVIAGESFYYMHDLIRQHAKTLIDSGGK
jgi:hypothetical protein